MSAGTERQREIERVWARRAAELAREPPREVEGEWLPLVVIRVGRELFGIEAQYVGAMGPAESITRVPRVPGWVLGVMNLRGRILSVVNPACFWDLPEGEPGASDESAEMVVVRSGEMELALRVDAVIAVEPVPLGTLAMPPDLLRGLPAGHVRGLVPHRGGEGEPIVVLDMPAFLADPRLLVNEDQR